MLEIMEDGMLLVDLCEDAGFIIRIIVKIVKYVHIIVPILLIVLITFDLFKVLVGTADEKAKSEAFNKAVKRFIYAAIVFLVPTIITFIFSKIEGISDDKSKATNTTSTSWISCWVSEYNK